MANILIKRKNLILRANKNKISSISPEAILFLEKHLEEYLDNLLIQLKEDIMIKGKKTLQKGDVVEVLERGELVSGDF